MTLARGIVEGHGGAIAVESSSGKGARFVIELQVDAPPGAADERDDLVAASPVPGKTILVVEDEPVVG